MDYRLNDILSRFGGHKEGSQIRIACPVHKGKDQNCAVWIDDKDGIAAFCHSHGCDVNTYLRENIPELYPASRGPVSKEQKEKATWLRDEQSDVFNAPREWPPRQKEMRYSRQWMYTNSDGVPINFIVVRYDHPTKNKKATIPFIWAQLPDGRKMWIARGPKTPQWYGLNRVAAAQTVVFVEGEKCASHINKAFGTEVAGVTWSGGSKRVADLDMSVVVPLLQGKDVILWPDNDDPGHDCMWRGTNNLNDKLSIDKIAARVVDTPTAEASTDCADIESIDALSLCLKSAKSVGEIKFHEVYERCAVARIKQIDDEQIKRFTCGMAQECKQCKYNFMGCGSPIDTLNVDEVIGGYVYVASEKRFVSTTAGSRLTLDDQGINGLYAHLPGYAVNGQQAASNQIKTSPRSLKVTERDFLPGKPIIFTRFKENTKTEEPVYNMWRPIVYDRSSADVGAWLEIGRNWASEHELNVIIQHMAFTLMHPDKKINWQILVRGDTGIGKSLFLNTFFRLFQRNGQFCTMGEDVLHGQFNGSLVGAKVASIEEMMEARGGYSVENRLKQYCAAPPFEIPINVKFGAQLEITNILSIYAQTNNEVPFKLSGNDRRWFIVDADLNKAKKLHKLMAESRIAEVLADDYPDRIATYLSSVCLDGFKAGDNAPESRGKDLIIKRSVPFLRDVEPELEETDIHDIVQISDILDLVQRRVNRSITTNHLKTVLSAMGYVNGGTQVKITNENKIRPWFKNADVMHKYMVDGHLINAMVREQWEKQKYRSFRPGTLLNLDDYR